MCALALEIEATNMGHSSVGMINVIRSMNYVNIEGFMVLESETMASLNILNADSTNNKKTVVELFGKACSKIGNSLLHGYLTRPLYDTAKINERLNTVETIIHELKSGWKNSLIKQIMNNIRGTADISRIYHELRIGNYKPAIWKKLRNYVINIISLKQHIQSSIRLMGCKVFSTFTESFVVEDVRTLG